jgi:DNA-binding XRE family transcriptional regulator
MLLIVCGRIVIIALSVIVIMTDEAPDNTRLARMAFGRRLRQIRAQRGLSQEQLADLAAIHRTYMSSVERGQRNIGLDNIVALARALGVSPAQFFQDD